MYIRSLDGNYPQIVALDGQLEAFAWNVLIRENFYSAISRTASSLSVHVGHTCT